MSETRDDRLSIPKLGERNFGTWEGDCQAKLMEKGVWCTVKPDYTAPSPGAANRDEWELNQEKAYGIIFSSLEENMKELIRGKGTDPKVIWKILKDHHQQKKPTSRYAALGELLGIRKEKDESLPSVCMHVKAAVHVRATPARCMHRDAHWREEILSNALRDVQ